MPNKAMADLHGMPVLGWVVRAAQSAHGVDDVIVATSYEDYDDTIEEYAKSLGVGVVRGSETDVLSRFIVALDEHPMDGVIRLTADCPLLDPRLIAAVAGAWRADPSLDLVSTVLHRTLPRGLDVELVKAATLRAVERSASGVDRVHVTSALYRQLETYRALGLIVSPPHDDLRVTLDTPEDYDLLTRLVDELPAHAERPPAWSEVVDVLTRHPELTAINAHIQQKKLEEG